MGKCSTRTNLLKYLKAISLNIIAWLIKHGNPLIVDCRYKDRK